VMFVTEKRPLPAILVDGLAFRADVAERERSTSRGVGSPEIVSRNSDCAMEKGLRYAVGCVVPNVGRMVEGEMLLCPESCPGEQAPATSLEVGHSNKARLASKRPISTTQ
jgi:hypothetical protein